MKVAALINGEHVCLRPVRVADAPLVHRWKQDPLIRKMALGPDMRPGLAEVRRDVRRATHDAGQSFWMIVLRETERPIGYVRVNWMEGDRRTAWLRFALGECRGRGLGKDAVRCLLAHLFRGGMHRVDTEVYDFNEASLRLLLGLGFQREGLKRKAHFTGRRYADIITLGLLREDFRRACSAGKASAVAASLAVRPARTHDRGWIRRMLVREWHGPRLVSRGTVYEADRLPAFVAWRGGSRVGLLTYRTTDDECEVVSLNSFVERIGVGSALIAAARAEAEAEACRRLWLVTSNDNTAALGFYQRRGFTLAALHRNSLEAARRLKPQIPTVIDGIPLRDEIELEMPLEAGR